MKKYMPSTGGLVLLMMAIVVAIVFYGQKIPKHVLFAEFFSKIGKIGASILMLLHIAVCVAGVFLVVGVLLKYEEWRNTD